MKKYILLTLAAMTFGFINAQTPGYYNGTENKSGDELKTALHNIISNHVDFSYSDAKYILNYADEDPNNSANLIQLYTNRSVSKDDWGTGGNKTNREHVWAKSHGGFVDVRPMDGDAHNLHAADGSVNVTRSNYDFDEVPGGTYIDEADAYYGDGAFEPADRDKGVVARTLFYMAVRYEGTNNEIDLEVVDAINTSGSTHGKLSTLLQWNRDFPPTEMEKRRNERVFQSQLNRNPFIDNPQFADVIWNSSQVTGTTVSNLSMTPENPKANETATFTATFTNSDITPTATLYWGKSFNSETYSSEFAGTGEMSAIINLDNFSNNELVYVKTVTSDGVTKYNSFYVAPTATLTAITDVQGTGSSSPIINSNVTVAGIVTANFDNSFYMQTGNDQNSGLCIYSNWRGRIGDSVAVTGTVVEYENLTEISDVEMVYTYNSNRPITPTKVSINDINESYEGMLIQLTGVNFSNADELISADGGTFTINEGSSSINVYARYDSRLCGQRIPNGTVNVTAIVSQYKNDYQLLIDNINWIEQGDDSSAPEIIEAITTSSSYIEVTFNEKIDESSVSASAFTIDGINIIDAYYYPSTKAFLLVSGLEQKEYTITATGINDLFGNTTTNATFTFTSTFTGINKNIKNTFTVAPNPTNGNFNVSFENTNNTKTLYITDLSGRSITQMLIQPGIKEQNIDMKGFSSGYYLVHVDSQGIQNTQKIIIQ